MSRLCVLRTHVHYELEMISDPKIRTAAAAHLHGVSLAAVMLAKKRGLDPELAAMAAMLHDLHAYKTGCAEDHAHRGAVLAREILETLGLTSEKETEAVCSAVFHHSDKLAKDGPMDELLKDADVMDHCMDDPSGGIEEREKTRFERLCRELGLG